MSQFVLVDVELVIRAHENVIGSNELQGLAKDKSLSAALERVHNRLRFGFISDAYDLAACYAAFLAKAHCFNDANKRTAVATLFFVLDANNIEVEFNDNVVGDWVVRVASDQATEVEFAAWLRSLPRQ